MRSNAAQPTYFAGHVDLAPFVNELQRRLVTDHVHPAAMLVKHVLETNVAVVAGNKAKRRCQRNGRRQMYREISLSAFFPLLQHRIEDAEKLRKPLFAPAMPPRW